jgi:glycerate kinase
VGGTVAGVRVLIAPDSFGGTVSAVEAAEAIASGWHRVNADADITIMPLSDGGPGWVDVIHAGRQGQGAPTSTLVVTVPGPMGQPVPATILLEGSTAYIESAQSSGLHLIDRDARDPWISSSQGLGHLLDHARDAGSERIVVGLGGTGTVDAGAGLLAALGAQAFDAHGRDARDLLLHGPAGFAEVTRLDIEPVVQSWAHTQIIAAVDVDVPLTGPGGAARGFAAQKFPDPTSVAAHHIDRLEEALARFAGLVPVPLDTTDAAGRPGAGAAGGIGWALMCVGAGVVPGLDIVAAEVGFDEALATADLVITGEGRLDWQSGRGKVVAGVAARASARGIPVLAIAGRVDLGGRELAALGIVEAWALAQQPGGLARSMLHPHDALIDLAARVASQWA